MPEVSDVVRVLKEEIERAKKAVADAEKLVKMGEDAGLDVAEQRMELESAKAELKRLEDAFKKHFG